MNFSLEHLKIVPDVARFLVVKDCLALWNWLCPLNASDTPLPNTVITKNAPTIFQSSSVENHWLRVTIKDVIDTELPTIMRPLQEIGILGNGPEFFIGFVRSRLFYSQINFRKIASWSTTLMWPHSLRTAEIPQDTAAVSIFPMRLF